MTGRGQISGLTLAAAAAGCSGIQSALDPSGPSAREIAALWWAMAGGGAVIFVLVLVALLYGVFATRERRRRIRPDAMVIAGGVALPVIVLSVMVPFNVTVSSDVSAPRSQDTLTIRVEGRQWWWDIEYDAGTPGGDFTTANELYLPVGEPVELILTSDDVIHSLWIPRLAGKLDLIPGHTNRLMLEADEPGRFRGQCAEFCGVGHAKMAFYVVAVEPERFHAWLEDQRRPASAPVGALAQRGHDLFAASGCSLCHAVRGHGARGRAGPDLTHVGSRLSIGAGTLSNDRDNLARWIAHNEAVKPGNHMPDFADLDAQSRDAIAAYLEGLR